MGGLIMNKKEIAEIKKQFTPANCSITRICGCYVDAEKNKKTKIKEAFLSLPEEEMFKYFDIFKKTMSGRLGKNLMNLDFPLSQEKEGGTQEFLMRIRASKLKDDELLDEFYDKVIENYDYNENYYIVLIHAVYDIPGKASDGTEMHDASEEIYEHILCSICPVNLSKAGLSYDVTENNIKDRIRDWVVSRPETGFLFPVFNDRSTDIHGTLYFNKNIKNIHPDFIENVLGTPIPRIPGNEINVFSDFIMDNFEGNTTFNFTESLVESLQEVKEQKKDSPEMITVSCDEMEQIFGYCGIPGEKLSDFKENWEMYFSNEPVALDNIHNSKTAKIVTPDATICIQPDKIALIELKEINGVPSLVVPVNGELKINGIEVELK